MKGEAAALSVRAQRCQSHYFSTEPRKPFTVIIKMIRKLLSTIERKKSVGQNGIPGEILKIVGDGMISFLTRLLDIKMNNNANPG